MTPAAVGLPDTTVPSPGSAPPVRWGVLGPGGIAHGFAAAVAAHTAGRVVAVGSRSAERAAAFAGRHGIDPAHAHGSYEALVADDAVDVVYVATPHSEHRAHALLALEAGRPVLVEKSFARSAAEGREVFDRARDLGLFAMEALWTRFLPQTDVLLRAVSEGLLGDLVTVSADHGQFFAADPTHRLFAPELAGGALLDLGVYPLSFAHMVLGPLTDLRVTGSLTDTGVDAHASVLARSATGATAIVDTTLRSVTRTGAEVAGTLGRIDLEPPFYGPHGMTLHLRGAEPVRWAHPGEPGDGMAYEAAEVARCLAAGRTESPVRPAADTLAVLDLMDRVRAELGVVFPGEAGA
jgi:predicted dehydrogenase